ncbi:MAG: dephospho-CoA kinase [Deltaproteobacteria bacterium]|nr:dephospho-CoA kinase [Deltaproteobacteria bacterium]
MTRRLLVGLTGGMASGKSTVARLLKEKGCTVFDADQVVADLYQPNEPGTIAVHQQFGPEMLAEDGSVDRAQLGAKVFADQGARGRLEAAIHPLVRQRTAELLNSAHGIVVYEATLLVEAGRADGFDLLISVEAEENRRLLRAVARGMDEAAARARLVAQGDGALRRGRADIILNNDGSEADLEQSVDDLFSDLQTKFQSLKP